MTRLQDDIREDISQWIDVSEFRVVDGVLPLGRIASEAPREQLVGSVVDVRRSLGMAPLDEAGGRLLAALGQRDVAQRLASDGARPVRGAWLARLASGLAAVRNVMARKHAARRRRRGRAGGARNPAPIR